MQEHFRNNLLQNKHFIQWFKQLTKTTFQTALDTIQNNIKNIEKLLVQK